MLAAEAPIAGGTVLWQRPGQEVPVIDTAAASSAPNPPIKRHEALEEGGTAEAGREGIGGSLPEERARAGVESKNQRSPCISVVLDETVEEATKNVRATTPISESSRAYAASDNPAGGNSEG